LAIRKDASQHPKGRIGTIIFYHFLTSEPNSPNQKIAISGGFELEQRQFRSISTLPAQISILRWITPALSQIPRFFQVLRADAIAHRANAS